MLPALYNTLMQLIYCIQHLDRDSRDDITDADGDDNSEDHCFIASVVSLSNSATSTKNILFSKAR